MESFGLDKNVEEKMVKTKPFAVNIGRGSLNSIDECPEDHLNVDQQCLIGNYFFNDDIQVISNISMDQEHFIASQPDMKLEASLNTYKLHGRSKTSLSCANTDYFPKVKKNLSNEITETKNHVSIAHPAKNQLDSEERMLQNDLSLEKPFLVQSNLASRDNKNLERKSSQQDLLIEKRLDLDIRSLESLSSSLQKKNAFKIKKMANEKFIDSLMHSNNLTKMNKSPEESVGLLEFRKIMMELPWTYRDKDGNLTNESVGLFKFSKMMMELPWTYRDKDGNLTMVKEKFHKNLSSKTTNECFTKKFI